jgi:hypothetical protein
VPRHFTSSSLLVVQTYSHGVGMAHRLTKYGKPKQSGLSSSVCLLAKPLQHGYWSTVWSDLGWH